MFFIVYLSYLMLCLYLIIVFFRIIHHRDRFSLFTTSFFFLSLSLPLHSLFFVCSLLSFACISFFFSYIQTNRTHTHTHVYRETYMKRHLLEMFAGGVEKRMSTCEDRKYLHLLLLLF